jgi:hypothetical protein
MIPSVTKYWLAEPAKYLTVYVFGGYVPAKVSIQNDVVRFIADIDDFGRLVLLVED